MFTTVPTGLFCLQDFEQPILGRRLVDLVDRGNLTHKAVKGPLIDLAFAVRLLRLVGVAMKVSHNFGD